MMIPALQLWAKHFKSRSTNLFLILRKRTEYLVIESRPKINSMDVLPTVKIDTCSIKRLKCAKMLGVGINEHLNWEKYTLNVSHVLRLAR